MQNGTKSTDLWPFISRLYYRSDISLSDKLSVAGREKSRVSGCWLKSRYMYIRVDDVDVIVKVMELPYVLYISAILYVDTLLDTNWIIYCIPNSFSMSSLIQLVSHEDAYRERSKCIPISAHWDTVLSVQWCLCDLCTSLVVCQTVLFKCV